MNIKHYEAAQAYLDQFLGDACEGCEDLDVILENTFLLAVDGAKDAGATWDEAREIAARILNGDQ